jgi:hypothetical protein
MPGAAAKAEVPPTGTGPEHAGAAGLAFIQIRGVYHVPSGAEAIREGEAPRR